MFGAASSPTKSISSQQQYLPAQCNKPVDNNCNSQCTATQDSSAIIAAVKSLLESKLDSFLQEINKTFMQPPTQAPLVSITSPCRFNRVYYGMPSQNTSWAKKGNLLSLINRNQRIFVYSISYLFMQGTI